MWKSSFRTIIKYTSSECRWPRHENTHRYLIRISRLKVHVKIAYETRFGSYWLGAHRRWSEALNRWPGVQNHWFVVHTGCSRACKRSSGTHGSHWNFKTIVFLRTLTPPNYHQIISTNTRKYGHILETYYFWKSENLNISKFWTYGVPNFLRYIYIYIVFSFSIFAL